MHWCHKVLLDVSLNLVKMRRVVLTLLLLPCMEVDMRFATVVASLSYLEHSFVVLDGVSQAVAITVDGRIDTLDAVVRTWANCRKIRKTPVRRQILTRLSTEEHNAC